MQYSKILEKQQENLKNGIDKIANAVKSTLGATGKNVLIKTDSFYVSTKDGVSVAKCINLEDPVENIGANLIKEVAKKACDESGDGPQPLYSKILTPKGFIEMGNIKIGDNICGTNNTVQQVVGIFPKGKKEIYEIEFADGRKVECCSNHIWTVVNTRGKYKNVTTRMMLKDYVNDKNRHKYYTPITETYFDEANVNIDPYLLGVLIGDGSLSENCIEITIGTKKEHILNKIILPKGIETNITFNEKRNCIRVKFKGKTEDGKSLKDYIEELGLLNVKSNTKFIPDLYKYNSRENRVKLLQGLLDTDGHINVRGRFEYSSISDKLTDDILELCRSLGRVVVKTVKQRKENSSYSLTPVNVITELKGYSRGLKIVNIKPTSKETEMQCIKVSNEDSLYITDDYVVTHNTTTATVLAQGIYDEALKVTNRNKNVRELKSEFKNAFEKVKEKVIEHSTEITTDEQIEQVAIISTNGDKELGKIVADTFLSVNENSPITIEESVNGITESKVEDGFIIEDGFINQASVTDIVRNKAIMLNSKVIVTKDNLISLAPLQNILENFASKGISLTVFCKRVSEPAYKNIIDNRNKGILNMHVVEVHGAQTDVENTLNDIATVCNCKVVDTDRNETLSDITNEHIGESSTIESSSKQTVIINKKMNKEKVDLLIANLEQQIKGTKHKFDIDKITQRINRLSCKVGIISVGGVTKFEIGEKKDRVDDALGAVRSAKKMGVTVGGGVALFKIANELLKNENLTDGEKIVYKAIQTPFRQILINSSLEPQYFVEKLKETNNFNDGVDVFEGKIIDLYKKGIIDPVKVILNSLESAISIVSELLTTDVIVYIEEKTSEK